MAGREVRVAILGDSRDFARAVGQANSEAGKLSGTFSKIGALAKTAAVGLAGGAVAAGAFAKSAIDSASNLNETLSKSNTIFGQQGKAMERWADGAAKGFGQSKEQALDAAATFGNMFTQLGIDTMQAAHLSASMTELASDFASFHNADITEVLEAQQAAFRGEFDAVQKFVPTINAWNVEQKALAMTGKKATKELTLQEKALATQALLMEGAGAAAGDFDRTSDSLANKQRIMAARFEDVKAKIGQGLLPIMLKAAEFVSDVVIPAFEKWGPKVVEVVQRIAATVHENWPRIQQVINQAVTTIREVIEGFVQVATTLWDNFGNNILEFVQRVWPRIQQVIEGAMSVIRGVIQTVTSLIKGDWSGVWEGIKGIVTGAWEAIQGIVGGALEVVRSILGAGLEVIGSAFKGAWEGIVGWFWSIPSKVGEIASRIWEALKSGLAAAIRWIGNQLDRLLGPLDEIISKVNKITSGGIGGAIKGAVPGLNLIPGFAQGGTVPGALGQPKLILAHGGEQVLTRGQQMRSGGGDTIVIPITIGGQVIERLIVDTQSRTVRRGFAA